MVKKKNFIICLIGMFIFTALLSCGIFAVVSKSVSFNLALKLDPQIFFSLSMKIDYNGDGDYADTHFPVKLWDAGERVISLSEFDWNPETRIMMFGNQDFVYGKTLTKPEITEGDPTRVYTLAEIKSSLEKCNMEFMYALGDLDFSPGSDECERIYIVAKCRKG